jgi:DNA-binding LacI/PurR family transcriptional regulator
MTGGSRERSICCADDRTTFDVTRDRLAGFKDAWEETGGDWSQVQVAVCAVTSLRLGGEATARLVRSDTPPDGLAAMSDELALGAVRTAALAGLTVPDALAVTGWDDSEAASPAGLSTVRQDLRDHGARCARIALGQPADPSPLPWQVIERPSTRRQPRP